MDLAVSATRTLMPTAAAGRGRKTQLRLVGRGAEAARSLRLDTPAHVSAASGLRRVGRQAPVQREAALASSAHTIAWPAPAAAARADGYRRGPSFGRSSKAARVTVGHQPQAKQCHSCPYG